MGSLIVDPHLGWAHVHVIIRGRLNGSDDVDDWDDDDKGLSRKPAAEHETWSWCLMSQL